MELVLLVVSFCCMIWGIYNYSEVQKLEFKSERTFMSMAKEIDRLKSELGRVKHDETVRWQRVPWPTGKQAKLYMQMWYLRWENFWGQWVLQNRQHNILPRMYDNSLSDYSGNYGCWCLSCRFGTRRYY